LKSALASSVSAWKIVYLHYPPYATSIYERPLQRWPFREWGADIVIAGHSHIYERIMVDGYPYIVNGLGGRNLEQPGVPRLPESELYFNADYGAMLCEASVDRLLMRFVTWQLKTVETFVMDKAQL
jgi:hypothetical protein